jgi:diguanylate cyclase (GGDEF)-like protein
MLAAYLSRHAHRSSFVLFAAALMTVLSFAMVVTLLERAKSDRDAELDLAGLRGEFHAFQGLPYDADANQGGSVERSRRSMVAAQRQIERTLSSLRRRSPIAELAGVTAPLQANFAANARIRALIAHGAWNRVDPVSAVAGRSEIATARALNAAGSRYNARAAEARQQAVLGTAAVILTLLSAFSVFYLRSNKARLVEERMAGENGRLLEDSRQQALTDALTGLANRRALTSDLARAVAAARPDSQVMLALFDLDGFKQYNDTLGHPAGDALLTRLSARLSSTMEGMASAYRLGGDEFCVLARVGPEGSKAIARLASSALSEDGGMPTISCSYGLALVPSETDSSEGALKLADTRLYAQKATGHRSPVRQSADVLVQVLRERAGAMGEQTGDIAPLSAAVAVELGLDEHQVDRVRLAAELHSVGKAAIPDAILSKPGPLDEAELEVMRRHTLIGERIILTAPSLAYTAELVRASHERVDGNGYPDGLGADAIPIGARIIAVCDAYSAMISDRPYRDAMPVAAALTELRRCSGTQFDPRVVTILDGIITRSRGANAGPEESRNHLEPQGAPVRAAS